jgi:hypothetical protein
MAKLLDLAQFQTQVHYDVGQIKAEQRTHDEKLTHFDELAHARDDRLTGLETKASAAEVSRRAIGDYAKELGSKVE